MRFAYVLPDPRSYTDWSEFEGDLACARQAGYDAVELQISDPADFDEEQVEKALQEVGYSMCAFQTGGTYYSRGNCLCTADDVVRQRTIRLVRSFVDLAARWGSVIVFGSLQGRLADEPDRRAGEARIIEGIRQAGGYAADKNVTIAFEPVNHLEVGWHNTIASVAGLIRRLDTPGVRMMIDTFHMNIEEKDMLEPLRHIVPILAHAHLSESNRDVLGAGHWDTAAFLRELRRLGYRGHVSVGVYNTRLSRRQCIRQCMAEVRQGLTGAPC